MMAITALIITIATNPNLSMSAYRGIEPIIVKKLMDIIPTRTAVDVAIKEYITG